MKKILIFILGLSTYLVSFAAVEPNILGAGLPGDGSGSGATVTLIGKLVAELIKYVAVVAVIALMWAGIMYIVSAGEEEKVKKAKKWIIWSLVGVFISISGYFLINIINNASITI